jgi:hypothetical protein
MKILIANFRRGRTRIINGRPVWISGNPNVRNRNQNGIINGRRARIIINPRSNNIGSTCFDFW